MKKYFLLIALTCSLNNFAGSGLDYKVMGEDLAPLFEEDAVITKTFNAVIGTLSFLHNAVAFGVNEIHPLDLYDNEID